MARVDIHGVSATGIIDSGADTCIMGGRLFKCVAAVARLHKKGFKKANKVPCTYDQKPFSLDGRMDVDVSFGDKTIRTPIYIKMDAPDELLLSEGVCRQLGIISYHSDVQSQRPQKTRPAGADKIDDGATVPWFVYTCCNQCAYSPFSRHLYRYVSSPRTLTPRPYCWNMILT